MTGNIGDKLWVKIIDFFFLEHEHFIKFITYIESHFTSDRKGLPKLFKNSNKGFLRNIHNDILIDDFIMAKILLVPQDNVERWQKIDNNY